MDRSLMNDATSQDDSPTPGYMLSEISKMTLANYQANLQVQDYLVSRVTHKNHNVKYKCLVIIKHICRTGRPEFKREMAKKVDAIKECLQFRGPPDPLRGDEIYKRVRDTAKETLDAIFDSQMPVTTSAVAAANRIQGIGNDYVPADAGKKDSGGMFSSFVSSVTNAMRGDGSESVYAGHPGAEGSFIGGADKQLSITQQNHGNAGTYNAPGGSGGNSTIYRSGSSGMVGLGNPNFKDARDEKSWYQKAGEMATRAMGTTSTSNASGNNPSGHHNFQSNNPEWNYASNRGMNAYGINQEGYQPQRPNALGSNVSHFQQWQQRQNIVTNQTASVVPDLPPANSLGTGRVGGAASDGQYERALLEALCEPGGLKPVPPEEKLQGFMSDAQTLSPDLVGNVLLDLLNSDSWQSRVKALIVIGTLVQSKECGAHKDWWKVNHEEVKALCNDTKATVRNQASKTYRILTGTSVAVEDNSTSASAGNSMKASSSRNNGQSAMVNKEESLLDMLDDSNSYSASPAVPATSASPTPNATSTPPPSAAALDLFSGMSISASTSAQPSPLPAQSKSMVSMTAEAPAAQASPAPPVTSNAISNSFDFLNDDFSAPTPPPPVPTNGSTESVNSNSHSNSDLFSGMNLSGSAVPNTPPPAAPARSGSVLDDFAGLSAPGMAPATTAATTTGFSFMNNSPSQNTGSSPMTARNASSMNASFAISSAFQDNPNKAAAASQPDSFAQLVNLGGPGNGAAPSSSSSSGRYQPMAYPGQQPPPQQQQQQQYPANYGVSPYPNNPQQMNAQRYPPGPAPPAYGYPAGPAGGGGMAPGMMMMNTNPNSSVLAPGMLNPMAPRKNIPTADSVGGPSGFAFLGGNQGGNAAGGRSASLGGNDSFNFVSDAMKDMKK